MSVKFEPRHGLVVVRMKITGPRASYALRVALDTGATTTMLSAVALVAAGYDISSAPERVQITTASGVESVPRISVTQMQVLGKEEQRFPVLCHTMPASVGVDGVLGLDFLRGHVLKVDFKRGKVSLLQ